MSRGALILGLFSALLLNACNGGSSATDSEPPPFVIGPDAPFATKVDPNLQLPRCVLPGGTIGIPDPAPTLSNQIDNVVAKALVTAPTDMPAQVFLRTDSETYNRLYQFVLRQGRVWYKSNTAMTGVDDAWTQATMPDCLVDTLIGIAVDDDELIGIRANGAIYGMDNALKDASQFNWSTRWGPPLWLGSGYAIPADYRAWSWTVISPAEDEHWTDPAGNLHAIGAGKVSHIWMLHESGQRYRLNDPWLPRDNSYEMCGPRRGRFRGVNLSASGSAIFTVNRYGDLYTRYYDFDLSGDDSLFFRYAYDDQRGLPNPAIQLPSYDWLQQPKVPGTITHNLSIHKAGIDMQHRILRIEGLDAQQHSGYWEKDLLETSASAWQFVRTDQPLRGTILDNRPYDSSLDDAGSSEDNYYARNMEHLAELAQHAHVTSDDDWAAELPDFNFYCPPEQLRIHFSTTDHLDLILHATDEIRQSERARGFDDQPRAFNGDIEIPEDSYAHRAQLSTKAQEFIQLYLHDQRHTGVKLSGVTGQITFKDYGWIFSSPAAARP